MRVKVTRKDIEKGKRRMYAACPVALAIRKKRKVQYAIVGEDDCCIRFADHLEEGVPLPLEARAFIKRFDGMEPVAPFEFELQGIPMVE